MLKLIRNVSIAFSLAFAFNASATIITTDLTADDYITYQGLDWAWASPVNQQFFSNNELMLPEFHAGWRFATLDELSVLATELSLASFTRLNGTYIQAAQYWNTVYTHVDAGDLNGGYIASAWGNSTYDTFYVRDVAAAIPEPSTLLIFALGLIGLGVSRKTQ